MTLVNSSNNHKYIAHLIFYFPVIPSFQWQYLDLKKKHGFYLMLVYSHIVKTLS